MEDRPTSSISRIEWYCQIVQPKGRPPFPVERRPNSLVCAWQSTSTSVSDALENLLQQWNRDRKVEASGSRHPGAIGSRCEAALLRGTYERCRGESTGLTLFIVAPDESLTNGWKLLEQGPGSQSASGVCSGGVSAVIGSSDLDALTFVSVEAHGNQLSCSLPFEPWAIHRGGGVPQQAQAASQCRASQRVPGL